MKERYEMRFTGSGGQGVISASVMIAEAAMLSGLHTVQSQAYGPEARSGMSKAEAVLSHNKILFFKVNCPDFLLALTQVSLDKYAADTAGGAVILVDDSLQLPKGLEGRHCVALPILRTAKEGVGKALTANVVAVGAINGVLGLFDSDTLEEAVLRHVPKGTEDLNRKALRAGMALWTGQNDYWVA